MLREVIGARRTAGSTVDIEFSLLRLNEDTLISPRFTVTSPIPQDLNPAYKWVLFPCFVVLVGTVRPVLGKNGLAAVVHDQDVDGIDTGGGIPRKFGWGASLPNDPQSIPTGLPTVVNGPVEFYYEPGWLWQYFFAGPVAFRPFGRPAGDPVTVTLDDWPFDWRGSLGLKGDVDARGFPLLEDYWYMTPGVNVANELVMTFTFPYEFLGAIWTPICTDLVIVPFGDISPSTVALSPGPTGVRKRGMIVGRVPEGVIEM